MATLAVKPQPSHTHHFLLLSMMEYLSGWFRSAVLAVALPNMPAEGCTEWIKQRESPHATQTLSSNTQRQLCHLLCFNHKSKTHTHHYEQS